MFTPITRPDHEVTESLNRPDILEDEMTLTWGVEDRAFEELGKKVLPHFKKATKFSLVLSGRIVPTNTYVNVWEIPGAASVQEMWSRLGKADQGEFGDAYNRLNDMILEENQNILYAYAPERPQRDRKVIYLRNRYWVESEDLQTFRDRVIETKWPDDLQRVGFGLAFTGKLNVFTVYLAISGAPADICPMPGRYSGLGEFLQQFDEVVSKQLPFHSIKFRPSTPQVLIPTAFDPSRFNDG